MTGAELLAQITATLERAGVPTPAVDAEWLVRHVTGWSRTRWITSARSEVPLEVVGSLEPLVARRAGREPLQLILGSVGFRHLEIEVAPGVFIPRPETEVLAGEAIARVPPGGVVVEPCTGTGAIACAIAQEAQPAAVIATDMSAAACRVAARNASQVAANITVLHGDLLDPVPEDLRGRVDVLVSNPPYLAAGELEGLEPEVVRYDPHEALVSGPSGHEVTDRMIAAAPEWLAPGGWLLLEVDPGRAQATADGAGAAGLTQQIVLQDLAGTDRIVAARRP